MVVLGDQLNRDSAVFDGFDPARDAVWMAEVAEESTKVWSSKARIAMFLSAMRHFAAALRAEGITVHFAAMGDGTLEDRLREDRDRLQPARVLAVEPGEWALREALRPLVDEYLPDRHFLCSASEFKAHAEGRRQLRMEFFYREMRKKHGVLMDGGQPIGGAWNYDAENRGSFGKAGPGEIPKPVEFTPDAITRDVIELVNTRFAAHPGRLDWFGYPVTAEQARAALDDFVAHRLPTFGEYQDAMWTGEPWLYHARISSSLNLKLLDPREAIAAAERAYQQGRAPLAAVEGFVRQILGWREYVRGIYWWKMPAYADGNALSAHENLPAFYWTGETDMRCLKEALDQTLQLGYAHHIQRLMVTGLYALLLGVEPRQVHEWYLAVYIDAVEWVEMPNTIGMSQYADGGLMASKPYIASGKYIDRMSNYCRNCRYRPEEAVGDHACPFTTLYWDFLMRHEEALRGNQRMQMQVRNLVRITPARKEAIAARAAELRRG